MRKRLVIFTIVVVALMGAGLLAIRPPASWSHVAEGMSRSTVYSLVGAPVINKESTKGGVRWHNDSLVGRWGLMFSFVQTTLSPHLESDGDGIRGIEQEAEPDHWTEHGRATSVSNFNVTGRPRRSVLALGRFTCHAQIEATVEAGH